MTPSPIEARYLELFGTIPENVKQRMSLARLAAREQAVDVIEQFRDILIHQNPLERKTQQLIHLGMLLVLGHEEPARLHVQAAVQAGAGPSELHGVCETAAIVGGMPAYSLGVRVCSAVLLAQSGDERND